MGSDSDLPVMKDAAAFLDEMGLAYELTVVSAHRTPDRLVSYAKEARSRGLKVIIAGAGGAAHLPGMVAAMTSVPVIGVPVKTRTMNGLDSLYSIVQMPPGIPVATVAINGAKNAGILAAELIGIQDDHIYKKVEAYKKSLEAMVHDKAEILEKIKYQAYLDKMEK
jgi:5-(carboxyamino)imidazole ribonucleotide mutase